MPVAPVNRLLPAMTTKEFYAALDERISKVNGLEDAACQGKGCYHCCYEALYVDEREADLMLETLPKEEHLALSVRTRAWLEKVRPLLPHPYPIDGLEWRKLGAACPFLVNNACSVYNVRPMGCRMFFACGKAEDCAMPAREHQKIAHFPPWFEADIAAKWFKSADTIRMDHLGCFLLRKVCGHGVPSGARQVHTGDEIRSVPA